MTNVSGEVSLLPSSRAFPWIWIATTAILGGLIYPAGVALWHNRFDSTNGEFVHKLWMRKELALEANPGPGRLLVVGGSGCLFSISAELLEKRLGQPAINLCSHAGVGLEYMLARVRRHAQPGDTVVLVAEYRVLINPDPRESNVEWDYYTSYDRRHYLEHGLPAAYRILYSIPFADLAASYKGWRRQRDPFATPPYYDVTTMNRQGDLHHHLDPHVRPTDEAARIFLPPSELSRRLLREFADWSRGRGVRVVAGYQALALDEADYGLTREVFATYPAWWRSVGIAVLESPDEHLYPVPMFLDTRQHGAPAVRYLRTEKLARALRGGKESAAAPMMLIPLRSDPLWRMPEPLPAADARIRIYAEGLAHPDAVDAAALRSELAAGHAVYVGDEILRKDLEGAGFVVGTRSEGILSAREAFARHNREIVAVCANGPHPFGSAGLIAGARAGLWRGGGWDASAEPALRRSIQGQTALGEPWELGLDIRVENGQCEMRLEGNWHARAQRQAWMMSIDPSWGIVTGMYGFDSEDRARTAWQGVLRSAAPGTRP
jgi:hypothetical protein